MFISSFEEFEKQACGGSDCFSRDATREFLVPIFLSQYLYST